DGSDGGSGKTWRTAKLTMAATLALVGSGDTVVFLGKLREQVTAPVQVFDVTIVGAGNRPRHADSEPTPDQQSAATWAAPSSPTPAPPLLKVLQQGWRVENFVMAGPSD